VESGDWADILSNVEALVIVAEFVNGAEEVRIDNVRLTFSPAATFDPCDHSDFAVAGADYWSFEGTGGIVYETAGGNGGGYVRVVDYSGLNSYAVAPAKFMGDWSSLDGAGYITLDLRVLSHSGTNEGAAQFLRISGPGGSAHVALSPADVPTCAARWKTFQYPLTESGWVLDSGTWPALLANVQECRIDLEFYTSTESVGLDNFGRMGDWCPAIDAPVTVHDEETEYCGYVSLVNAAGIALNPRNDSLYCLRALAPSSGGGLYKLSDPGACAQAAFDRPAGLIFDLDGNAFVSENYDGYVYRLPWGGATPEVWVSGLHSGDDDPYGMAFAPVGFSGPSVSPGDILVSDPGNAGPDEIWAFSPGVSENEKLVMPDIGSTDQFDLASGPYATVYLCDAFQSDSIYTLDAPGIRHGLALGTPVGDMVSIVYDSADVKLYVAGRTTDSVYEVDPVTGAVSLVASGFTELVPCCLELDVYGRKLWVSDAGHGRVYELCLPALVGVRASAPENPLATRLRAVPNPFEHSTTLRFDLRRSADGSMRVYDISGRLVRALPSRWLEAGPHSFAWDGRDADGKRPAPGVYFVRVTAGEYTGTAAVLLVR
jgi:hypothetical protein